MSGMSVAQQPEHPCDQCAEQEEHEPESSEGRGQSTQYRVARRRHGEEPRADDEQHRDEPTDEPTDEQGESRIELAGRVGDWSRFRRKLPGSRAQANLPALAVALLVLTTTAGLAFSLADGAYADASRDATDRRLATGLADRLVAADSPVTVRAGVLDEHAVENLTAERFTDLFPASEGVAVRLRVDDRTVVERGDPDGGATSRRIALVADRQRVTHPLPAGNNRTTLPRRTDRVTVEIDQGATRVRTVRANGRVVLHEPSGLNGSYTVRVSRYETATLSFDTTGPLATGQVRLTYAPRQTTKAVVEVTVDA